MTRPEARFASPVTCMSSILVPAKLRVNSVTASSVKAVLKTSGHVLLFEKSCPSKRNCVSIRKVSESVSPLPSLSCAVTIALEVKKPAPPPKVPGVTDQVGSACIPAGRGAPGTPPIVSAEGKMVVGLGPALTGSTCVFATPSVTNKSW